MRGSLPSSHDGTAKACKRELLDLGVALTPAFAIGYNSRCMCCK